jgi:uncharacterized protein (UPF0548 family)
VTTLDPPEDLGRLTYPVEHLGASLGEVAPPGFAWLRDQVSAGHGAADLERATEVVRSWRVLTGAGIRLDPPLPTQRTGAEVVQRVRVGPLLLTAPCVVVAVLDEPRRRGFAYGTVAGHPECGEESFVVEQDDDGAVRFTITSFSRPGTWWSRLGAPVTRRVQRATVDRYLEQVAPSG